MHEVAVTICGAFASVIAATLAAMPDLKELGQSDMPIIIMDDTRMRLFCIIGAIGGAVLSALIFTPPKATGRQFGIKVAASSLAGILFTPMTLAALQWKLNIDRVLGASAVIAMLSIGVLRMAVPWAQAKAAKWFGIGAEENQDEPPKPQV